MGYMQLTLLFLMFFPYVAFRVYYARKYGEWETLMRNRIRDYRVMHGLDREAFSTRLGVNRQTIVAVEKRGSTNRLSISPPG